MCVCGIGWGKDADDFAVYLRVLVSSGGLLVLCAGGVGSGSADDWNQLSCC